jgi:TPR repeat protein
MFIIDAGVQLERDIAPETNHAGLLLLFGQNQDMPTIVDRHLPLFGEEAPLPDTTQAGGVFMTASHDDLSQADLEDLSEIIFSGKSVGVNASLQKAAALFKSVLKDAFHTADNP